MRRSYLVHLGLFLVPSACGYSPSAPIVVSASDGESSESGTDTTPSTSSDPTTTMSTSASTMSTDSTTPPTTTDGTADSSSSDSTSTDEDSGSSSEGGPLCGNNMLDGDEVCDDGNEVDGDGCNNDCIESGTELWVTDVSEGYVISDAASIGVDGSDHSHVVFPVYDEDFDYSSVLRELDTDGSIIATTEVDDPNPDPELDIFTNGIAVAPDGSTVLTGTTDGIPDNLAFVFGYDPAGMRDWSRVIDPGTRSNGRAVDFDDNGDFAFAGTQGPNPSDGLVAVYDALGNELWSEVYSEAVSVSFYDVDARDDEVFVVGTVGASPSDAWLRKYTANGVTVWTRTYAHAAGSSDGANAVAADGAGNVFVAGIIVPMGEHADGWVAKYTPDGDLDWERFIDGGAADADQVYDAAVDASDNVVVVGRQSTLEDGGVAFAMKYDNDGTALWTNTWNAASEEYSLGVATMSGGDVVVAAYESDGGETESHIRVHCFAP